MRERVGVYIDGFNLYFGLRDAGLDRFRWLDVAALADNLLQSNQDLIAVKYFTALISGPDAGKRRRQQTLLDALWAGGRVDVVLGRYMKKRRHCKACGAKWNGWEEKMTDVNIAAHLATDAHLGRTDVALVVSGDSDLALAYRLVRQMTTTRIIAVFPPQRGSHDLDSAADGSFSLGRTLIGRSLLPDPVVTTQGKTIARPVEWKASP
jgi:uncharacterized LabA/DUF88 family protein